MVNELLRLYSVNSLSTLFTKNKNDDSRNRTHSGETILQENTINDVIKMSDFINLKVPVKECDGSNWSVLDNEETVTLSEQIKSFLILDKNSGTLTSRLSYARPDIGIAQISIESEERKDRRVVFIIDRQKAEYYYEAYVLKDDTIVESNLDLPDEGLDDLYEIVNFQKNIVSKLAVGASTS